MSRKAVPLVAGLAVSALVTAALVPAPPAYAWGDEGHEVVALIASSYLTAAVRAQIDQLLSKDRDGFLAPDMARAATWADRFRSADRATAGWHYTDLQLDHPDMERACETARSCAPDKVVEFAQVLANDSAPPERRLFALKMVLHLVGDLHQPLHAATARVGRRNDAGANCEKVAVPGLFGTQHVMSLHAYWDDRVVSSLDPDATSLARRLRSSISRGQVLAWARGGPADWTWQSYEVARDVAYRYGRTPQCDAAPAELSPAYQKAAQEAAAEQLQRAGVRLAFILNQSLSR